MHYYMYHASHRQRKNVSLYYLYPYILMFKLVASEKNVYFKESYKIYRTKCRFLYI